MPAVVMTGVIAMLFAALPGYADSVIMLTGLRFRRLPARRGLAEARRHVLTS
jgi:hypothetical protein